MFHSDYHAARKQFHQREFLCIRIIIREGVATHSLRTENQAQKRLAEGTAPRMHGAHITEAGLVRAVWMRVQKADDIVPALFTLEHPEPVEFHARTGTALAVKATPQPDSAAALPHQRPALFHYRLRCRG